MPTRLSMIYFDAKLLRIIINLDTKLFNIAYILPSHVRKRVNVHKTLKNVKKNKPNQNLGTYFHSNVKIFWQITMKEAVDWRLTNLPNITFGAKYAT